jgi:hypothetical protein
MDLVKKVVAISLVSGAFVLGSSWKPAQAVVQVEAANCRSYVSVGIKGYTGFMGTGGYRYAKVNNNCVAEIDFDDYGSSFEGEIWIENEMIYKGTIDSNGYYYCSSSGCQKQ